jgi:hypothetical protein
MLLPLMASCATAASQEVSDMGYQPQWGRSLTLKAPFGDQTTQSVRLHFKEPRDVTAYLEGQSSVQNSWAKRMSYRVSVGLGGISVVEGTIVTPAVGCARHWVADTIQIDALVSAYAVSDGSVVRTAAGAGYGTPYVSYEAGGFCGTLPDSVSQVYATIPSINTEPSYYGFVHVSGNSLFRVPAFGARARITTVQDVTTDMRVQFVTGPGQILEELPASAFADFQPIDPNAWWIVVRNTAVVGGAFDVMVTLEKFT